MGKTIFVKPIINKSNNQININLKRKDLPKDLLKDILDVKRIKIELEDWD